MSGKEPVVSEVRFLTMQNVTEGQPVMWLPDYAPASSRRTVYRITQVNKTTVTIDPIGGGRKCRAHPCMLVDAPAADVASAEALPTVATPVGTVVTISGLRWSRPAGELFSVTSESDATVAVARLGGDGGRYWSKIPRRALTVVRSD